VLCRLDYTVTLKQFGLDNKVKVKLDPEGFRKLSFLDFMTTAQDGGKVVSLTHRPPLPPGNAPLF